MSGDFMRRDFSDTRTCVFWDVEDCPIPEGCDPDSITKGIESALANEGYGGIVQIRAYGERNKIWDEFIKAVITVVPQGDKRAGVNRMMKDVLFWALDHPVKPSVPRTVMVISQGISENIDFLSILYGLKRRNYSILLTDSDHVSPVNEPTFVSSLWVWTSLSQGGKSIDQSTETVVDHKPGAEENRLY